MEEKTEKTGVQRPNGETGTQGQCEAQGEKSLRLPVTPHARPSISGSRVRNTQEEEEEEELGMKTEPELKSRIPQGREDLLCPLPPQAETPEEGGVCPTEIMLDTIISAIPRTQKIRKDSVKSPQKS